MSVVDTRFGHTEGRVCLAYNEKNNKVIQHSYPSPCLASSIYYCFKIVSVGSDGEMRVWSGNVPQHDDILDNAACEGIDDDDCENTLIGDEVLAMAASTAKIFTGVAGTNVLSGYNWDGEGEGVVGPRSVTYYIELLRTAEIMLIRLKKDCCIVFTYEDSYSSFNLQLSVHRPGSRQT